MARRVRISDISKPGKQLIEINPRELSRLPYPYDNTDEEMPINQLTDVQRAKYETSLDGFLAIGIPKPESKDEEKKLVRSFLTGLSKLLSENDNWTFLQPLMLSLEYCMKCQNCSDACPVYIASGKKDIYRPTYRSEVLRRIVQKYLKKGGRILAKLSANDIELNWTMIARLAELAYRCTICRRCAQACPIGIDNGLITREIRKLLSQEMGIAPAELHELGTIKQLNTGSSTGIIPKALTGIIQFMEEEIEEKTGKKIKIPVDKKGADILLIHNTGEFLSWLENPIAFAIIFEAAGISWTLSSEIFGYEATNYGVWYDDVQLAKIALRQAEVARKLGVEKIVIGECGHAHKALAVTADRLFTKETYIPRQSCIPLLDAIVHSGIISLDPNRNNFLVTLHDPCNLVRMMGIVEPQRRILKKICPQFQEMGPNGVDNYCCGGGGGLAIISFANFTDWRSLVAGRVKLQQILETFEDVISKETKKYVCTPCSNCKGQLRDIFSFYEVREKCNIIYGGLADLIVNAMVDVKEPFISWE